MLARTTKLTGSVHRTRNARCNRQARAANTAGGNQYMAAAEPRARHLLGGVYAPNCAAPLSTASRSVSLDRRYHTSGVTKKMLARAIGWVTLRRPTGSPVCRSDRESGDASVPSVRRVRSVPVNQTSRRPTNHATSARTKTLGTDVE